MKYKALIFDIDGVLVPLEKTWLSVSLDYLHQNGISINKVDFFDQLNTRGGSNFALTVKRILQQNSITSNLREIQNLFQEKLNKRLIDIDHITNKLANILRNNSKHLKCIVSSRNKEDIKKILNYIQLENVFDAIVSRQDVSDVRPKPYPDQIYLACKEVSVNPEDTIFFGDTLDDALASNAANSTFTFVYTNDHSKKTLKRVKVYSNYIFDRSDLPDFIIKLSNG